MTPPDTDHAHDHDHGSGCGHPQVRHGDHTDFLHDGHLHHAADAGVEEHEFAADDVTPDACTPDHGCAAHTGDHAHGACEHQAVPHAGHVDYLVEGHLHHPHGPHCDDHGAVHAA